VKHYRTKQKPQEQEQIDQIKERNSRRRRKMNKKSVRVGESIKREDDLSYLHVAELDGLEINTMVAVM
jgi:hypothetical protein